MIENLDSITSPRPFLLPGSKGNLFSIFYPPSREYSKEQVIVHVPAFAEEMNKSRRMVALQARQLADQGIGVLVVDLFGTGDSSGDFSEACWETWKSDLNTACHWLQEKGVISISFWAIRMGALLAMDFASKSPILLNSLLLWQPVLSGEALVMQFLRLRVAASMFASESLKETTSDLKQQIADGQFLEVAGYTLNPALITPLMALRMDESNASLFKRIFVFEVVSDAAKKASPANQKFVAGLQQKRKISALWPVVGSPFWSTQEIVVVPDLLQKSTICMTQHQE